MRCEKCDGTGRVHSKNLFGQGHAPPLELNEIGPCPECGGTGVGYCCEGASREDAMIAATDANPNDAG